MNYTRIPYVYHIESPNTFHSVITNRKVVVKGWCLRKDYTLPDHIFIRLGDRLIACNWQDRPDVRRRFHGDFNFPMATGFTAEFTVGRGFKLLRIFAQTSGGESYPLGKKLIFSKYPKKVTNYRIWVKKFDRKRTPEKNALSHRLKKLPYQPLISVILPVRKVPIKFLKKTLASVYQQVYSNWELCIAYNNPHDREIQGYLRQQQKQNQRIKLDFQTKQRNNSALCNDALALATGEYVTLLEADGALSLHALAWVVDLLNKHHNLDIIYSDEDKIDPKGIRFDPYFKPDWNQDLLLSHNYVGHLIVITERIINALGGFRPDIDGCHEWDLLLRAMELTEPARIRHIPKILYHACSSTPNRMGSKNGNNHLVDSSERVLADYLNRNNISGRIVKSETKEQRISYHLPSPTPRISIIIPTKDHIHVLKKCVSSILNKTNYPKYTITIVDNGSKKEVSLNDFDSVQRDKIRILKVPGPFNFSRIINRGVAYSGGDLLAFLNNDTEVISSNWLIEMASHAVRPGIGVVGAKLCYPNGKIQHAGVILGIGGVAGHIFRNFDNDVDGQLRRLKYVQNYSAVTGACMVVKRLLFEEVGGFNEDELPVAFNDIDFCLRILALGYRNLFTPSAELYHYEAYSRGPDDSLEKQLRFRKEFEFMQRTWGGLLNNDPAYNLNLTLLNENFDLASPPRL